MKVLVVSSHLRSSKDAFWRRPDLVVHLRLTRLADKEGVDTSEQMVPHLVVVVDQDDRWLGHSRRATAPSETDAYEAHECGLRLDTVLACARGFFHDAHATVEQVGPRFEEPGSNRRASAHHMQDVLRWVG